MFFRDEDGNPHIVVETSEDQAQDFERTGFLQWLGTILAVAGAIALCGLVAGLILGG
jgi:hypothetical protein